MTNALRKPLFLTIALIALTFTAYSFALNGNFKTLDDEKSIVSNEHIRSFSRLGDVFTHSFFGDNAYYRPLVTASYMVEYHFFGLNPLFYYLTNILLHIATSLLVWRVMDLIFKRQLFAYAIGLLFALHPIHWEAVTNIPGRAILLAAFFSISAFYLFCRAKTSRLAYAGSLLCFSLALLCKESAMILPLLLLSYQFFVGWQGRGRIKDWAAPVLPFLCIDILYIGLRQSLGMTQLYYWRNVPEAALGFLTFLRSVITHIRLMLVPVDLQFDRARALFTDPFHPQAVFTILFFAVVLFWILRFRKRISFEAFFFLSWFAIELIPVSQIWVTIGVQPGYISTADHFLYMPAVGFLALLALFFQRLDDWNRQLKIVSKRIVHFSVGGLYAFLFLSLVQANIYSSNEIAMFERTLKLNPNNVRIRISLALNLVKLNRFVEAEHHFRQALNVNPHHVRGRIGLAKSLCDQGRYWECVHEYERIPVAGPLAPVLDQNLRLTYNVLTDLHRDIVQQDQLNPFAHYNLAHVYEKTGNNEPAVLHYAMAVYLKPDFQKALKHLVALAEKPTGPQDPAPYPLSKKNERLAYKLLIEVYTAVIRRDQKNPWTHYNLARAYHKTKQYYPALLHYSMAVRLDPSFRQALFKFAAVLQEAGRPHEAIPKYQQLIKSSEKEDDLVYDAYLGLAEIYQQQGNEKGARYYQTAADRYRQSRAETERKE